MASCCTPFQKDSAAIWEQVSYEIDDVLVPNSHDRWCAADKPTALSRFIQLSASSQHDVLLKLARWSKNEQGTWTPEVLTAVFQELELSAIEDLLTISMRQHEKPDTQQVHKRVKANSFGVNADERTAAITVSASVLSTLVTRLGKVPPELSGSATWLATVASFCTNSVSRAIITAPGLKASLLADLWLLPKLSGSEISFSRGSPLIDAAFAYGVFSASVEQALILACRSADISAIQWLVRKLFIATDKPCVIARGFSVAGHATEVLSWVSSQCAVADGLTTTYGISACRVMCEVLGGIVLGAPAAEWRGLLRKMVILCGENQERTTIGKLLNTATIADCAALTHAVVDRARVPPPKTDRSKFLNITMRLIGALTSRKGSRMALVDAGVITLLTGLLGDATRGNVSLALQMLFEDFSTFSDAPVVINAFSEPEFLTKLFDMGLSPSMPDAVNTIENVTRLLNDAAGSTGPPKCVAAFRCKAECFFDAINSCLRDTKLALCENSDFVTDLCELFTFNIAANTEFSTAFEAHGCQESLLASILAVLPDFVRTQELEPAADSAIRLLETSCRAHNTRHLLRAAPLTGLLEILISSSLSTTHGRRLSRLWDLVRLSA